MNSMKKKNTEYSGDAMANLQKKKKSPRDSSSYPGVTLCNILGHPRVIPGHHLSVTHLDTTSWDNRMVEDK